VGGARARISVIGLSQGHTARLPCTAAGFSPRQLAEEGSLRDSRGCVICNERMKAVLIRAAVLIVLVGGAAHAPGEACPGQCIVRTFQLQEGSSTRTFAFHVRAQNPRRVSANTEIVRPVYADGAELTVTRNAAVSVRATEGRIFISASNSSVATICRGNRLPARRRRRCMRVGSVPQFVRAAQHRV
jgi:hypothetical protein